MRFIVALVVVCSFSALARAGAEVPVPTNDNVFVRYVPCAGGAVKWSIDIEAGPHGSAEVRRDVEPQAGRTSTVRLMLDPGHYHMFVYDDRCSAVLDTYVPSGHDVTYLLIGTKGTVLQTGACGISGLLSVKGVTVAIVYKKIPALPRLEASPDGYFQARALVEDGGFSAPNLPDGDATIRLYDATGRRWVDVATVVLTTKKCFVQRDISDDDIRKGVFGSTSYAR